MVVVVITDNRNPIKALPWIVVLLFVPIVGLVLYIFLGQNLSKKRIINRRTRKRITTQLEERDPLAQLSISERHRPLSEFLRNTLHAIPQYGSEIEIFTDGQSKFEALLQDIATAREHIHLQYYIFDGDTIGTRLRDALIAKCREGVEVRVLYDDVGCSGVRGSFFEPLRRAGGEVYGFLNVRFPLLTSKVNYRNHRKIVVIDGRVGYFGGMNVADRYLFGTKKRGWRDTHFRVEGSGALGLQVSFLSDWSATTKRSLDDAKYFPASSTVTNSIMQVFGAGPFGQWRVLLQAQSYAIARAKERIWLQTPYYLPTEMINSSLLTAALSGVDVRLMIPSHSDSKMIDLASHSYIAPLIQAGGKVYLYEGKFLHSKMMIVDSDLALVGSSNVDFRSFEHNFEINAFIYDELFTERLSAIYEQDIASCDEVSAAVWFNRPRRKRLAESFMRLFAPLF